MASPSRRRVLYEELPSPSRHSTPTQPRHRTGNIEQPQLRITTRALSEGLRRSLDLNEDDDTDTEYSPLPTRESSFFRGSTSTAATSPYSANSNSRSMCYPELPPCSPAFRPPSSVDRRPTLGLEWELNSLSRSSSSSWVSVHATPASSPTKPCPSTSKTSLFQDKHEALGSITEDNYPQIRPLVEHEMSDCQEDISRCNPPNVDLEPFVIAHDSNVQKNMDKLHISWCVQYELARGVSNKSWRWSDVTLQRLKYLVGDNAVAAQQLPRVMRLQDDTSLKPLQSDLAIWQEVDREQKALMENKDRGLGLCGDWEGAPNWYGGRVQQIGRLEEDGEGNYNVSLEPLEMHSSNRFARFLGSRRILQLRISRSLLYRGADNVRRFLQHKFVLCGRVFVPFHAKECVYMVETDEDFQRHPDSSMGDKFRTSFQKFIQFHNPMDRNWQQPISKWATRWGLGLSTSIPAVEFDGNNMFYIDDIYSDDRDESSDPRAEQIMTDGCGFMNGAALMQIAGTRNLSNRPTAVQGRIAGAKGLWTLNPRDRDPNEPPRIWIRKSQRKIDLGPFSKLARVHRVFDLVAPSRTHTPERLSMQIILNLSHNGVSDDVFISLMQEGVKEEARRLTDWTRPNAMVFLSSAINNAGNVSGMRMQRQALGATRALGLTGRDYDRHHDDDQDPSDDSAGSGHDRFSGTPLSLHESALELVHAGFHPAESGFLYEKVQQILRLAIENVIKQFHYPVLQSARAFIIPDPCGVLQEGEIFFRSSEPLQVPETGTYFDTLIGDVIVGRYPIHVPSDMRKVKAVNYPELASYYDVAIFSLKGCRSLQSWLSGGDSDGDEVWMAWMPQLLAPFTNSPHVPREEGFMETNFDRSSASILEFARHLSDLPSNTAARREIQSMLLLGLNEKANVGLYSNFHDNAVYAYGYPDSRTIRLAHMFEVLLDAAKSGLQVKPDILSQDKRVYDRGRPESMQKVDPTVVSTRNVIPLRRDPKLGKFVLDSLVSAGELEQRRHSKEYDDIRKRNGVLKNEKPDKDLTKPYEVAKGKARGLANRFPILDEEINAIEGHVRRIREAWNACVMSRTTRQKEQLHELSKRFAEEVQGINITSNPEELKASYAYILGSKFGFSVAFRELCAIKARAQGQGPVTQQLLETMKTPLSSLRALAQNKEF